MTSRCYWIRKLKSKSALQGKVAGDFNCTEGASAETKAIRQEQETHQQGIEVQIRKNFNETAFFFPDLHTDQLVTLNFLSQCPRH